MGEAGSLISISRMATSGHETSAPLAARSVATELVDAPIPAPFMGAEDFSYVLQRMPGCMMFLGVMPEGCGEHDHVASCHSNHKILNEDAMAVGIAMHAAIGHRFPTEPPPGYGFMGVAQAGAVIRVDPGGTFTDVILLDPMHGWIVTAKTPCAPAGPSRSFVAGVGPVAVSSCAPLAAISGASGQWRGRVEMRHFRIAWPLIPIS
jgi:hypothetical protein